MKLWINPTRIPSIEVIKYKQEANMKFPYGISDFRSVILENYFYCDRTDRISKLEREKYQLFLRPRRFGKSMLLSMLENYYDVAKKDEFNALFGHLKIGKNPTPLRNAYFILKWDFSCIDASGSLEDIRQSLYDHINDCIEEFILNYKNYAIPKIRINSTNALSSVKSLTNAVQMTGRPVFLLIDEYDNFANEVMMSANRSVDHYEALVKKEGVLKTVFKNIKSSASSSMFDRIFITGVSPVVMSDVTSGFNIGESVYFEMDYNDLCGFTEKEIRDALSQLSPDVNAQSNAPTSDSDGAQGEASMAVVEALNIMKLYYNGYCFSYDATQPVYNPTLALFFFKKLQRSGRFPENMFDENLAMDEAKLIYISTIEGGSQLIIDLMQKGQTVETHEISQKFGIRRMLSNTTHDRSFLISFLFYFGILTFAGRTDEGKKRLAVPNLIMRRLYVERLNEMLIPEPVKRDAGRDAAEKLYTRGEIGPLCTVVEQTFFTVFRNRDYRWANELTVKTAFLTLLYNDLLFIMDSEKEIDRRYADLTMIIRPDMRHYQLFDILIEFKYVSLSDAGVSGETARALSSDELAVLPPVRCAMADAEKQLRAYGMALNEKYSDLRLKSYGVVALGFERLCWCEVSRNNA
ncbi:AAA family ATPase [Desulfamplus magnetovallimortis]|uniref:AAA family ATPase n=1 Tax=Desulfamplus magnetovallimortis TaxID=1246637 RepID=UPI001C985D28|nr:AAA family ATPase [Desulfamplus magnetovallimortis]